MDCNEKAFLRNIIPTLKGCLKKGDSGKIAVIGGCEEYTGAPYFAAMSALKVGADIAHVFCTKSAAPVIKSYSPELIVHPYIADDVTTLSDKQEAVKKSTSNITQWLPKFDALVIGPGLGRNEVVGSIVLEILKEAKKMQVPLILDADVLHFLRQRLDIIGSNPLILLTPNDNEYNRLLKSFSSSNDTVKEPSNNFIMEFTKSLNGPVIIKKGEKDIVCDGNEIIIIDDGGSYRRVGGQGDILAGTAAVFIAWAQIFFKNKGNFDCIGINGHIKLAAAAAAHVVRLAQKYAFKKMGRSMLASDVICELGLAAENYIKCSQ